MRGAWKDGRPGKYIRPFAGMTVKNAIPVLDWSEKDKGGLPGYRVTMAPYFVNGDQVSEDSERVLMPGDVITADDP